MLLSLDELIAKYDMKIDGVLHCGAHLCEEVGLYARCVNGNVWWVEAEPKVAAIARKNLAPYWRTQKLVEALLWSEDNVTKTLHVTNYDSMSSSLLEFGTHPTFSPDTKFVEHIDLVTTTIDTLVEMLDIKANLLNMDLQGVEGHVLRGATKFLEQVDFIISEVNEAEVYVGCSKVVELDAMLSAFERVETHWVGDQGWGDSLFVRKELLHARS